MALKLGELVAYLRTDNKGLKDGLAAGRQEMRRGGRDMEQEAAATAIAMAAILGAGGQRAGAEFVRGADGRLRDASGRFVAAGREAGDGFTRGADGRLRDSRGRFSAAGRQLGEAASSGVRGGLDSLRQGLGNFASGVTNVVTNVWNLIPVLSGIGAAAVFSVPGVYLLGGALASLPALAAGGLTAFGALGIGVMGLSDHFKETAGSAGSVVDKTWQVHQAQRALANAQREAIAAQEALNRARADEVERLSDLNRELREARLSEQEAALDEKDAAQRLADARNAVTVAQQKLHEALASGDPYAIAAAQRELLEVQKRAPDEIRRAELAYERAKLAVEAAKDRTEDLTREQERAARVGVEGSDQVRAALDRQRRAVEALEDAQHALNEARKPAGGGGGAAQELMRLAPAAQQFVDAIKSLKPAWESLRLDVQQRLFRGLGGEVKALASAWLPTLRQRLGGMADTFNGILRLFSRSARKPQFISDLSVGIESVQRLIDRVGRSLAGPFMDAFGRLARAAEPFIDTLGDELGALVDDFSAWIKSADESGSLKDFMAQASEFLGDVFDMGRDVASIFGSIMTILFGEKDVTASPWVSLRDSLDDIAEWFADPENQETVREWIDRIKEFGTWLITDGIPTVASWVERIDGWITRAEEWGGRINQFRRDVVGAFNSVITFFTGLPGRISRATASMWNGLWFSFRRVVNQIIGGWNRLSFEVGGGTVFGMSIPSVTLNTPNIPYLARGGHVTRQGAAVVGERGPELLELPAGATVRPLSAGSSPSTPQVLEAHIEIGGEVVRVVHVELRKRDRGLRRRALAGTGGN